MNAITLEHISRSFPQGDTIVHALSDISLTIKEGEKVAIVGASGSGKSTLLSIMSGMDTPDSGSVEIHGRNLNTLTVKERYALRNKEVALIFQSFELIPAFTALENVMLPREIRRDADPKAALSILERVGLLDRSAHTPKELSGGEEQRVAIARAIYQSPKILFADEPTGNLDRKTGEQVFETLLREINEHNMTFVMITHDPDLAKRMDTIYRLDGGRIVS